MATELSDYQKDILIRTALGEARGEGIDGMADVIQTIFNRANSGRFPSDPAAVALQPSQYSTWNSGEGGNNPQQFSKNSEAYRRAEQALNLVASGERPDRTNGALYYHTPAVSPYWADEANQYGTTRLGNHIFYNGRPTPPGEIPNQVASLTDTVAPRVAPTPVTISPDLRLARNPLQSPDARNAQVTPLPPPLPRNRPSAPDIVTPTMAALNAPRGNVNATRAVDMLATTQNPVTPRLTAAGDNIYSYHIPDMTPTTVTGGLGSLTPSPARVRLPELPPSNIGQPPTTRSVQSVPFNAPPASSMPRPTSAQVNDAARRAALTANQGNVERAIPTRPTMPTAPTGSASGNINAQRAEQLGQRAATNIPMRLSPGVAAQNYDISINGPPGLTRQQFAALPTLGAPLSPAMANVPFPRARPNLPAPMRVPQSMPRMAQAVSPLRAVVNGAGSYSSPRPQPMTPIQSLMAQGMSQAQAYNALTQRQPTLEDRVTGRTGLSSYSGSAQSLSS